MSAKDEAARSGAMGRELTDSAIEAGLLRLRSDARGVRMQLEATRAMLDQLTDAVHRIERELSAVQEHFTKRQEADRTVSRPLSH